MVMYLGRCVEKGTKDQIFNNPRHPYTQALLSATPHLQTPSRPGASGIELTGELPSPLNPPPGCAFNARCRCRFGPCTQLQPQLKDYGGQLVACFAVNQDENPRSTPDGALPVQWPGSSLPAVDRRGAYAYCRSLCHALRAFFVDYPKK